MDEIQPMRAKLFNEELDKRTNSLSTDAALFAQLAKAGINILSASQLYNEGAWGYIVNYEFQWRSRGNYIWSKSVAFFEGYDTYVSPNTYVSITLYRLVKMMRELMEDKSDKGKYDYIDLNINLDTLNINLDTN